MRKLTKAQNKKLSKLIIEKARFIKKRNEPDYLRKQSGDKTATDAKRVLRPKKKST
jgi:hypothetical protein